MKSLSAPCYCKRKSNSINEVSLKINRFVKNIINFKMFDMTFIFIMRLYTRLHTKKPFYKMKMTLDTTLACLVSGRGFCVYGKTWRP